MTPVMYTDAKVDRWMYQPPFASKKGMGKNIYVNASASSRRNPRIQLPKCRIPFGLQDGLDAKPEATRKNLEISVDDVKLQELFSTIDESNKKVLIENSASLFGKTLNKDSIEFFYRAMLKPAKSDSYSPMTRLKVVVSGKYATKVKVVTDQSDGMLKYRPGTCDDLLVPNSEVITVVDVGGMWTSDNTSGMSLVASEILVYLPKNNDDFGFMGLGPVSKVSPSAMDVDRYEPEQSCIMPAASAAVPVASDSSVPDIAMPNVFA